MLEERRYMIYLVLCYYGDDSAVKWFTYSTFSQAARFYLETVECQEYRLVALCKIEAPSPWDIKVYPIESTEKQP